MAYVVCVVCMGGVWSEWTAYLLVRHISANFRIEHNMGIWGKICVSCENVLQDLRTRKNCTFWCAACAVVGVALGIALHFVADGWWQSNRLHFAYALVYGGAGGVLATSVAAAVLAFVALWGLSVWRRTQKLCFLVMIVAGVYCGANCCALFACVGGWAILYVVLVQAVHLFVNFLCCFWVAQNAPCNKTFRNAFWECRPVLFLQILGLIWKIVAVFALLRPIFAVL